MPAAPRSPLSARWCFTVNNPDFDIPINPIHERISYLVYQKEVGELLTPHVQGYLEVAGARVRRTWLLSNIPWLARARLAPARGTAAENLVYCTKEEGRLEGPFTHGVAIAAPRQGNRTDLDEVMELIRNGATNYELNHTHVSVMARYANWVNSYRALHLESLVAPTPFVARPGWQENLSVLIEGMVSRRKVVWMWSYEGDRGKSYFANHFDPAHSHVITGGKHADIYYTLASIVHGLKVVFFDYGRAGADVAYPVMEKLKDGMFTTTKYESRTVRFNPVHVVVFANQLPDITKLSLDRWDIREIL